jgi:opacity protein-like surface antigen
MWEPAKWTGGRSRAAAMAASTAIITAALLCLDIQANAADFSLKDERPAIVLPTSHWAGLYVGAQAGSLVDSGSNFAIFGVGSGGDGGDGGVGGDEEEGEGEGGAGGIGGAGNLISGVSQEAGDATIGLHLGYNWVRDPIVFGLEADIDAKDSLDTLLGTVRGRIGLSAGRALFYGTAGVAFLSVDDRATGIFLSGAGGAGGDGGNGELEGTDGEPGGSGSSVVTRSSGGSETGYVVGGGVELKLSNAVGIGVEGLYYSFDDSLGIAEDDDFFTVRGRLTVHLNRGEGGGETPQSWAGFYVGAHAGGMFDGGRNLDNSAFAAGVDGGPGGDGEDDDDTGGGGGGGGEGGTALAMLHQETLFGGGAQLGYNWQSGNWVFGVEGDATFSNEDHYRYLASARTRLGYASGSYLIYGTAGIAFAGTDRVTSIYAGDGQPGADGEDSEDIDPDEDASGGVGGLGGIAGSTRDEGDAVGFVIGAGVDAKLTDRITLGFEGLYYSFDDDASPAIADGASVSYLSDDSDVFVLRSRLSFSLSRHQEALK